MERCGLAPITTLTPKPSKGGNSFTYSQEIVDKVLEGVVPNQHNTLVIDTSNGDLYLVWGFRWPIGKPLTCVATATPNESLKDVVRGLVGRTFEHRT